MPELAKRFADYFAERNIPPDGRVFPTLWKDKGKDMFIVDVKAAGIPVETAAGVIDFHSLRTTFASLLNQAGVPLVTAQKLMRRSDPKLTANFYTKTAVEERASAVVKLPPIFLSAASSAVTKTPNPHIPPLEQTGGRTTSKTSDFGAVGRSMGSVIDIAKHGQARTDVAAGGSDDGEEKSENSSVPQGEMPPTGGMGRNALMKNILPEIPKSMGRLGGSYGVDLDGFIRT